MKTITDTVRTILKNDETAREAASRGILNSSAYAREIASQVKKYTWKDVEESSITVSVNRVSQENTWKTTKPTLLFDKISVETGLVDITFEKTQTIKDQLQSHLPTLRQTYKNDLFIETSGQHQITMIMSADMWQSLENKLQHAPIGVYTNQVAISIAFDEQYLSIPNFIYGVLGIFALDGINITEIFSTMTEITVVINSDDLDVALARIKKFMK